jgi:hypothetical protein
MEMEAEMEILVMILGAILKLAGLLCGLFPFFSLPLLKLPLFFPFPFFFGIVFLVGGWIGSTRQHT